MPFDDVRAPVDVIAKIDLAGSVQRAVDARHRRSQSCPSIVRHVWAEDSTRPLPPVLASHRHEFGQILTMRCSEQRLNRTADQRSLVSEQGTARIVDEPHHVVAVDDDQTVGRRIEQIGQGKRKVGRIGRLHLAVGAVPFGQRSLQRLKPCHRERAERSYQSIAHTNICDDYIKTQAHLPDRLQRVVEQHKHTAQRSTNGTSR